MPNGDGRAAFPRTTCTECRAGEPRSGRPRRRWCPRRSGRLALGRSPCFRPGLGGGSCEEWYRPELTALRIEGEPGETDNGRRLQVENAQHRGQLRVRGLLAEVCPALISVMQSYCWQNCNIDSSRCRPADCKPRVGDADVGVDVATNGIGPRRYSKSCEARRRFANPIVDAHSPHRWSTFSRS